MHFVESSSFEANAERTMTDDSSTAAQMTNNVTAEQATESTLRDEMADDSTTFQVPGISKYILNTVLLKLDSIVIYQISHEIRPISLNNKHWQQPKYVAI